MRPVGNALELKLCKIPTIGTQSENQTLPTGNISLGSPIALAVGQFNSLSHRIFKRAGFVKKKFLLHASFRKSFTRFWGRMQRGDDRA
ncbi:hypothetical protein HMPREF1409_01721 [Helicobacter pylori GAM246Ai]|nr:hypothetical protein [Helicobacter pylori]EMG99009.1 hypothetical protein HMPREF1402_00643 [Helicobacter pylori GAM121Aii]EMH05866.1 hypothetical protein HMPREF1409_01721 [Helicobacter pylori GAM246Ai]